MKRQKQVAAQIRARLAYERISQAALAEELPISKSTLHRRLAGESPWHYDELETIAAILHTNVSELVGENHVNGTSVTEE